MAIFSDSFSGLNKSLANIASQAQQIERLKKQIADKAAQSTKKTTKTGVGDAAKGTSSTTKLDTSRTNTTTTNITPNTTTGTVATSPDLSKDKQTTSIANDQYAADLQTLQDAYNSGKMDGIEYQARKDYLAKCATNGTYMEDREGGLVDIPADEPDTTEESTDTGTDTADGASSGDTPGAVNTSTGIQDNVPEVKSVDANEIISSYNAGGARLTSFDNTDGSTDDARIAYIKLLDPNGAMAGIASGENKQILEAIYTELVSGYSRFILTAVQESRADRNVVMATVGDSFAATFSGREPRVISIQGHLIYDYDRAKTSWYLAFMNAYEYYLRGSRLAKYRTRMKLVLPDFTEYTGYMLSIGSTQSSDNDMVIPFNFSMLVIDEAINKAYGPNTTIVNPTVPKTKTVDANQSAAGNAVKNDTSSSETKDPADVGADQNQKVDPNGTTTVGERRGVVIV